MYIFIHRVNTIEKLKTVSTRHGVELDIRGEGNRLLLSHDPITDNQHYDELEEYLKHYQHAGIIFNLKEAGYETRVLELAKKYNVSNYFLLDVEFPYLYRATRKDGERAIAVRYSEAEPIEVVEAQILHGKPLLDWVWIDTNTRLPLSPEIIEKLSPFKTCLVCPERWGRPEDILDYGARMDELGFMPTAIMTSHTHASTWEKWAQKNT